MEKVNVGLIGAGDMANSVHYPSLKELEYVNLVAVCDLVEDKAKYTAEKFGIQKMYTSYMEMIEKENLDAVYILMPPHILFDSAAYCLQKKLHVFVEKPLGVCTFQAESLARLADKNGCITLVGFNRRFIPMMTYARSFITERGKLNQVVSTFYKKYSAIYYNGSCDVIEMDMIHAVDLLRWMAGGEVTAVKSLVGRSNSPIPNIYNALVQFDNGVIGVLLTNWDVGGRIHTFEMHCPSVSAFLNPNNKGIIYADGKEIELDTFEIAGSKDFYKYYGYYHQTRHFIDCVKNGKKTGADFNDAVKTAKLCDMLRANGM